MVLFNDYAQALLRGDVEAAEIFRRLDIPDTLLKFVGLDGGDGYEAKFGSLERGEIWLSSARYLNDWRDLMAMTLNHDRLRVFGCTEQRPPRAGRRAQGDGRAPSLGGCVMTVVVGHIKAIQDFTLLR